MHIEMAIDPGDYIYLCVKTATDIANKLGIRVYFTHNETRCHADPGEHHMTVKDRWARNRTGGEKHAIS